MYHRTAWIVVASFALGGVVHAQQPERPQKHPYEIGPEAGPWAICVTCYFDNIEQPINQRRDFRPEELQALLDQSEARVLAIDFVTVLRGEFKLPAYMFNRGDEERKKEEERVAEQIRNRRKMFREMGASEEEIAKNLRVKRLAHIQNQYVVMIGGYPDQESARMSLSAIRKINLQEKHKRFCHQWQAAEAPKPGQVLPGYRTFANPFSTAFVVPNPTGPKIKPPVPTADDSLVGLDELNERNKMSPLKSPGKWTLVVKKYQVPVRVVGIDPVTNQSGKAFDAVTKQAESLASLLRHPQLNFESYVLHTNRESLVTVGLFDSEKDPRLFSLQSTLAKLRLDPEQLMNPPMPIQIPRSK